MRRAKQPNLSPLLYLHFRFWHMRMTRHKKKQSDFWVGDKIMEAIHAIVVADLAGAGCAGLQR
jgi:hypothetical protein